MSSKSARGGRPSPTGSEYCRRARGEEARKSRIPAIHNHTPSPKQLSVPPAVIIPLTYVYASWSARRNARVREVVRPTEGNCSDARRSRLRPPDHRRACSARTRPTHRKRASRCQAGRPTRRPPKECRRARPPSAKRPRC
ncbi:hypothetical protein LX36DRAFT_435185 [Colletotrichum falcatum]|nr:hypothetical protein LX36DRAFT_435185 [Colletotrichum falcatum]